MGKAFFLAALLVFGCSKTTEDKSPPGPAFQTYTVRGEVREITPAPGSTISIYHEEISGFLDADGKVVGMKPMQMPFDVSPLAQLSGIDPGDKVEFSFEVRWSPVPTMTLTRIRELPDGTSLKLGLGSGK